MRVLHLSAAPEFAGGDHYAIMNGRAVAPDRHEVDARHRDHQRRRAWIAPLKPAATSTGRYMGMVPGSAAPQVFRHFQSATGASCSCSFSTRSNQTNPTSTIVE
jgi:hypothetical protein